jgi:lysophospholipase L1-like esterase
MKTQTAIITVIVLTLSNLACSLNEPSQSQSNVFEEKWGSEINAFKQWDAKNSVPDDAVLFVGSSSIRLWETARCFPDIKLINRGFGGSDIKSVNYFFDQIVACYSPSKIVLYAGDNDIADGLSPKQVCEDFKAFHRLCKEKLPNAEIVYLSIKCSGLRYHLWPKMNKANTLIDNYCQTKPNLQYVDLASSLLDKEGIPDDSFFEDDKLHLNEAGYRIWTDRLKPVLQRK